MEQAGKSVNKTYSKVVLFSLVPLDEEVITASRIYGEYYIFDLPSLLSTHDYKDFCNFLLSVFPTATEKLYHPAPGFLYNGEKCTPSMNHITLESYKKFSLYWKRYILLTKEIETAHYMSANDIELINDIRSMTSVRHVAEKTNVDISTTYYKSIDRVIGNDFDGEAFGDAVTFAYIKSKKSINDMKRFFNYHFNTPFDVQEDEDYEQELTSRTITE